MVLIHIEIFQHGEDNVHKQVTKSMVSDQFKATRPFKKHHFGLQEELKNTKACTYKEKRLVPDTSR